MRLPLSTALAAAAGLALAAAPALAQTGGYSRIARRDAPGARVVQASEQFELDTDFNATRLDSRGRGSTLDVNAIDPRLVTRSLTDFSRELSALYGVLRSEEARTPSVRAYLGEVNTYKVDADIISRDIVDARSVLRHEAELRELDAGWNRTARALKSIPGLTRTASAAVDAAIAADRQVEQALQIQGATLDHAALQRAATGLEYAVGTVAAEIEFGAAIATSQQRRQLLTACNSAQQQARRMEDILYEGYDIDRNRMIEEYRRFTQLTAPVVAALRTNADRGVGRAVRNLQGRQREVSDLLLIDRRLDRDELRYKVADLEADVERFFSQTNLNVLRDIPRADQALASADAFWGVFENFRSVLKIEEDPTEWADAYRYIDEEWQDFRSIYSAVRSEQARTDLKEIEAGMSALRESLSLSAPFDRAAVAELAAAIEANAYSIKSDGEDWLRKARPPYMTAALRDLVAYEEMARRFHEGTVHSASLPELQRQGNELFEQWKVVYGHIKKCQTEERPYLAREARATTPAFRTLQATLVR